MIRSGLVGFARRLLLLAAAMLTLASCTTLVPSAIPDEQRDLSGRFDGWWNMTIDPRKGLQNVAGERYNCDFTDYGRVGMNVSDGRGTARYAGKTSVGNIAEDGRFRIEVPSDYTYQLSRGVNDNRNTITYVFQGQLGGDDDGLFVIGSERLNNTGCSTRLKIVNPYSAKATNDPGRPETKAVVGRWVFEDSDIPQVSSPSRLTTALTIEQDGNYYIGELDITMTATPGCGELVSRSTTPLVANLDGDRLVVTFTETSQVRKMTCGEDSRLAARRYLRQGSLAFKSAEDDIGPYLKFRERCGWRVDGKCVFNRPALRPVGDDDS